MLDFIWGHISSCTFAVNKTGLAAPGLGRNQGQDWGPLSVLGMWGCQRPEETGNRWTSPCYEPQIQPKTAARRNLGAAEKSFCSRMESWWIYLVILWGFPIALLRFWTNPFLPGAKAQRSCRDGPAPARPHQYMKGSKGWSILQGPVIILIFLLHFSDSSYHPYLPFPPLSVQLPTLPSFPTPQRPAIIHHPYLSHLSESSHHPYLPSWNCSKFPSPGHPGGQEQEQAPWAPDMNSPVCVVSQFHGTSAVTRVSPQPQSSPRSCLPRWGSVALPAFIEQFTKVWIHSRAQKTQIEMHPAAAGARNMTLSSFHCL